MSTMVFVAQNSRIRIVGVEMIRFRQNRNYTAAAERIPERQNLHRILWSEPQKWCAPPDSKPHSVAEFRITSTRYFDFGSVWQRFAL